MRCVGIILGALKRHTKYAAVWLVFVFIIVICNCHALPWQVQRIKRSASNEDVQNYLARFGYLPDSCLNGNCLLEEDHFREAVAKFQDFGHIPVTGVVDEATKKLMRTPRCGVSDIPSVGEKSEDGAGNGSRKKRYVFQGQKWTYQDLTWSLESRQFPNNLDYYAVEDVLEKALAVWSNQSRITFRKQHSSGSDILIYFERHDHGDGYAFDGQGRVLAHAFFPGPGRGGDAHFDSDEEWSIDTNVDRSRGTSLFMVAAHEFGHSLGLSHSDVPGSLMYPYYRGHKSEFALPDDDREAIQALYGAKVDPTYWYTPPTYTPPKTPSTRKQPPPYRPPSPPPPPPPPRTPATSAPPREPPRRPYFAPYTPQRPYKPPTYPDRPYYPPEREPYPPDVVPDTCDTSYDAISIIRRELFIFKDKYMWRLDDRGKIQSGYPCLISQIWAHLPVNFTHVDAVYEKYNNDIVFFIGREVYSYKGNLLNRGFPKPLTSLGLPAWLDHIDAVLVWGHNSKTYFYSGKYYWRFDEEIQKVELDYPRNISIWKGIGENIDAAFRWKDGATYFFKNKGFWKFSDQHLRVSEKKQTASAEYWMGCPKSLVDLRTADDLEDDVQVDNVKLNVFATYQYEILVVSLIFAVVITVAVTITVKRSRRHSYIQPKRIDS